ncbi:hypothetical protein HY256_08610, partial [Candidatus Sumerlaeota bacterium]|nr:hypothetical protein [Candidatus Sumerlaeota bacterium]
MDWLHPRNFSRPEKAWVIGYGCILIVLTSLPFLVFYSLTPAHQQYAWSSVFYYDDYFQYYAWAQHIARGEWLIRNYYTGNPEASFALFNPYFIIQGWTTRILVNMYLAHHVLRICAVAVFSYVSYAYLSLYVTGFRARATAQLLMLGGGIEFPWYYYITQSREPTPLADPHIFKILYRYGHLTAC